MYRRNTLNPARIDRDDEKRMLPCRYFLAGFCHKGSRCKFYHPNMHLREPCIRVPDLPSNFTRIPQYGQSFGIDVPSLFEITGTRGGGGRSRNYRNDARTPPKSGGSTSPQYGSNGSNGLTPKQFLSPSSHAYSEYFATHERHQEGPENNRFEGQNNNGRRYEKNMRQSPPNAAKTSQQNTVFNHIDWSEFLVPGINPPPPTLVPEQGAAMSPIREVEMAYRERPSMNDRTFRSVCKISSEDVPPEGSQVSANDQKPESDPDDDSIDAGNIAGPSSSGGAKKLSAKEELQLKVKQIAQELADEPVLQVRSLDSFFRDYKFNGSSPSAMNEEKASDEEQDGNKENTACNGDSADSGEINIDEESQSDDQKTVQ